MKHLHNIKNSRGFTIVEALVALVVLSIGMLGMAGLFVTTLRSGGSAISRMQAVSLASDMADRIRANPDGQSAYAAAAATSIGCMGSSTTPCTSATMAANDLFVWQTEIANTLPGSPTGTVAFVPSAGAVPGTYTITVTWSEAGQSTALSYQMTVQL